MKEVSDSDGIFLKLNADFDCNYEPFIRSITFARFKNLRRDLRIDFTYPVTALIGGNGSNKTSILRALEGCPDQKSIGYKWFTTEIDRLDVDRDGSQTNNSKDPYGKYRFFYSYRLPSGQKAEVLKTRAPRRDDPDYWEPASPVKAIGMSSMPKIENISAEDQEYLRTSHDRWKPIKKDVIFVSFKYAISSFDLHYEFFNNNKKVSEKKKWHRARAKVIHEIFELSEKNISSYRWHGKERVVEPCVQLSNDEIKCVGNIIGREYESISIVRHSCFELEGYTVRLKSFGSDYSEAFAGSGEFSAVMLVRKVSQANSKSLILLDEPETSLHPRAQRELMRFLVAQAKKCGHQIVLATHSAECISELPADAIKVLQTSKNEVGQVEVDLVSQESLPEVAFNIIGMKHDKRRIYVEDRLSSLFVRYAISAQGKGYDDFETVPYGSSTVLTGPLLANLARTNSTDFIIVDGDQNPYLKSNAICSADSRCERCRQNVISTKGNRNKKTYKLNCDEIRRFFTPDGIPIVKEIPPQKYMLVLEHIGCPKKYLGVDGNKGAANGEQLIERAKKVLYWAERNLRYLPGTTPDALLIELTQAEGQYEAKDLEALNAKKYWEKRAKELFSLDVNSDSIYFAQMTTLTNSSALNVESFSRFVDSLRDMVSSIHRVG